jgi:hypothetical protein
MNDTPSVEEKFFKGEKEDQELLSLPARKKQKGRNPWIMGIVIVIGCLLLYWLRVELVYFFASGTPLELGDVTELDPQKIPSNTYVHIEGIPNPTRVVKFSKRLSKGFYRLFPLVGSTNVYVQLHLLPEQAPTKRNSELPGDFTGRAVRFYDLEKTGITSASYRNIRTFFLDKFEVSIPEGAVLVMDGDHPRSYWLIALMAGVVLLFIVLNTMMLVSTIVRRVKMREAK